MTAPLTDYRSWGGLAARGSTILDARDWLDAPHRPRRPLLAYGNGRSYGDSCLNDGGTLIDARSLDDILAFDRETGLITCGAGLMLGIELVADKATRVPFAPEKRAGMLFDRIAYDNGLVSRCMGDTLGFSPPLIVTEADIDEIADRCRKSLKALEARL